MTFSTFIFNQYFHFVWQKMHDSETQTCETQLLWHSSFLNMGPANVQVCSLMLNMATANLTLARLHAINQSMLNMMNEHYKAKCIDSFQMQ